MADYDYEPNQDVVNLSKVLTIGVVGSLLLAIIFTAIYSFLTPGVTVTINIWGDLYALSFIIAFFFTFYALLLIVTKDDSNIMRVSSLIYAIIILGALIAIVFVELSLGSFFGLGGL